jgi:hypothetical protein
MVAGCGQPRSVASPLCLRRQLYVIVRIERVGNDVRAERTGAEIMAFFGRSQRRTPRNHRPVGLISAARRAAYAEHYGLTELYSEDFQHDRLYGSVRVVNPFLDVVGQSG